MPESNPDWMVSYIDDLFTEQDAEPEAEAAAPCNIEPRTTTPLVAENPSGEQASSDQPANEQPRAHVNANSQAPAKQPPAQPDPAYSRQQNLSYSAPGDPAPTASIKAKAPVPDQFADDQAQRRVQLEKLLRSSQQQSVGSKPSTKTTTAAPEQRLKSAATEPKTDVQSAATVAPNTAVKPSPSHINSAEPSFQTLADTQPLAAQSQWHNGRPPWAQHRFDVLLFKVSGLTLAVPLVSLGQIQKLSEDLTPLFGQASWFMGLLPTQQGKIRCVDTGLFVMPDRYKPEFRQHYRLVITIDGLPWGLVVDQVDQPISLQPDEVNWRGARSNRSWLAGTIREHRCALLDVAELGRILSEQDRAKKQP